jgi:hypothetical protein
VANRNQSHGSVLVSSALAAQRHRPTVTAESVLFARQPECLGSTVFGIVNRPTHKSPLRKVSLATCYSLLSVRSLNSTFLGSFLEAPVSSHT